MARRQWHFKCALNIQVKTQLNCITLNPVPDRGLNLVLFKIACSSLCVAHSLGSEADTASTLGNFMKLTQNIFLLSLII